MARFITSLLAVSCALSAAAAAVTFPAMVELDIVFPRNESYAPAPVFPFVFAIQNLAAASSIGPLDITWAILKPSLDQPIQLAGNHIVNTTNSTDTNPHYINLWTTGLNETMSAGTYQFWWMLNYYACLGTKDSPGEMMGTRSDNFTFTLDPGAQPPNLSRQADLDACPAQNATIVITETWPVKTSISADRDVCGVVSKARVDANPCAAKLDSVKASSIAASVTASACAASPPALTSGCAAASETKDSEGSRVPVWSGLGMWPLLGCLLLLTLQ